MSSPTKGIPAERSLDGKYLLRLVPTDKGTCAERFLDDRDQAIVDERMAAVDAITGPRVGDYVLFADGTERRISYSWPAGDSWPAGVQTSEVGAGRWYLGKFGLSFSGSLHPGVSIETLTETDETRDGAAWIFHHDSRRAHNGVDFKATFRVYRCELAADEAADAFAKAIAA